MMEEQPGAGGGGREPTEEELRAALEAQLSQLTVDQVLLESVVSLVNLAGRRMGLAPGAEDERDLDQVRMAIEAVRALMPVLESGRHKGDLGPIRNALSQLQMAYAGEASGQPGARPEEGQKPREGEGQGPAASSSRLWIPGQ